jgi:hypothetical protein
MKRRTLISASGLLPLGVAAQPLMPVKLIVVRRLGLSFTNQCLAPCIRGSVYDVSDQTGAIDQTIVPLLKAMTPICDVIERPWANNAANKSSVPKGIYGAKVRSDRTKDWMTNENRSWRLELQGTQPRQAIQFHYGQDVQWSQGCFIVGKLLQPGDAAGITTRYCRVEDGENAIVALRAAVTAKGRDPGNIKIAVVDEGGLFPGMLPSGPC